MPLKFFQRYASFQYRLDVYKHLGSGQEGKAESIIELLEEFEPVPQELREAIMREKNMDTLSIWHRLSAKVESLDEFIEKSGIKFGVTV